MALQRKFRCSDCGHRWEVQYGTGESGAQMRCPKCGSHDIHRAEAPGRGRGPSAAGRGRGGPGRGPRLDE
jgi:predicted RNA-binding Zn-ribbon protein involved in translation (DUF1610 family)